MESILIKDLMVPLADYATVSEYATLSEAVLALKEAQKNFDQDRYRHRAVLVLDKNGRVVGKVSQIDALKALEPRYRGLEDLESLEGLYGFKEDSFRRMMTEHGLWKQPIDDICRKAATLTVRDIMHTPTKGEYVAESATLNEAVHQLILGHHQSLLVTRGDAIVGVLRLTDVFHRISDMMAECKI
jgi:CBS domain-containing protein